MLHQCARDSSEFSSYDIESGYQNLFSTHLGLVRSFEGYKDVTMLLEFPGPQSSALARVRKSGFRFPRSENGLDIQIWEGPSLSAEPRPRDARTQIRLLRLAIAALRGDPLPNLEDPFTGKALLVESGPKPRKFWSSGYNFVDDGGAGDFTGAGKDLVLELPR
jgi:hypothetical protein